MKKLFSIFTLLLALTLSVTACGTKNNNSRSNNSSTSSLEESSSFSITESSSESSFDISSSRSLDDIISSSSSITESPSSEISSSSSSISSVSSSSSFSSEEPQPEPEEDSVLPTLSTIDTRVNIGDPFIFTDSVTNKYYLYGTTDWDKGFSVWQSSDMQTWTKYSSLAYSKDNCGISAPFGVDYWSPEVTYNPRTQKYIMYFSATQAGTSNKKIGVATSSSPLGPFVHSNISNPVMFDAGNNGKSYVDVHFFCDDDGKAYLLYCNEAGSTAVNGKNASQTWIKAFSEDWLSVYGAPTLLATPDQEWETKNDSGAPNLFWNSAPAMYKHSGKYYLTYSANPNWNALYGVGCAVSDTIFGTYEKYDWNPILVKVDGTTSGTGHSTLFKDLDNNLRCSYQTHATLNDTGSRKTMISPAWFDNGILKIEYGQTYQEETTHTNHTKPKVEYDITTQSPKTTLFPNVDGIGDPYILADSNTKKYYLYATSGGRFFPMWESDDLQNWTRKDNCLVQETANSFGYCDFWAPEVKFNPTTRMYVMHYSARQSGTDILKVGVAMSSSPLGPFVDVTGAPMFDLGTNVAAIDASIFQDDDGQAYLYYSKDCSTNIINGNHVSQSFVVKVDSTWTKTIGEHKLVATPIHAWELKSGDYLWNEGPFVFKYNGLYYLTYSANYYMTNDYSVGVAVSTSPMGEFVKSDKNPIVTTVSGRMTGPGHCMFFTDFDGYFWCCYHVQMNMQNPDGNRKLALSGAWINNGELVVEYKK